MQRLTLDNAVHLLPVYARNTSVTATKGVHNTVWANSLPLDRDHNAES